jgi:excisionase family DNA binding protein
MEATTSYPNLLSEKQAAKRLGVARITLLRAREAGRIRFFRIGTRVLYCAEQLTAFLESCERNSHKNPDRERGGGQRCVARRKDNQVSSSRSGSTRERRAANPDTQSAKTDQVSLPFSATR